MSMIRTEMLAKEIFDQLKGTADGHCGRVDFLEEMEAIMVCQYMAQRYAGQHIAFHILISPTVPEQKEPIFITTDEAIEIRNRKRERLCLFIPSNLVDAAYSSLANSFAIIDGRKLHAVILKRVMGLMPAEAQDVLRFVSRGTLQASYDQRLDFAMAALELKQSGDSSQLGLELWRVGLIADASPDFVANLKSNGQCTQALAHPPRVSAMTRERIQSLKVDKQTALALGLFFRGKALNDVQTWSRHLASQEHLTFDCWKFPLLDQSDIRQVSVTPFVNAKGVVERYCHLAQPDEANGSLKAACGPKGTMVVRWTSVPVQPSNLSSWNVRIVPSDGEGDLDEESDFIEPKIPRVPGHLRSVTIKLDIEEEEIPTCPVVVRVAPLDAAGNEITDEETRKSIYGISTEFFLVKDITASPPVQNRESRSTVPTVAFGQLELAMQMGDQVLEEPKAQWIYKDLAYFNLSYHGHGTLNIGLSNALLELERQIREQPRQGGCFTLSVDEVCPVEANAFVPQPLQMEHAAWASFWKVREAFFTRLKKVALRDLVETADWTPELAGSAVRYAQSYRDLLDTLVSSGCEPIEVLDALAVDTLLVKIAGKGDTQEEAVVILPTHPLRVAWFANYTQLLRAWEKLLVELPKAERKRAIDIRALRLLAPMNIPAFAFHTASTEAFTFFQNLRFFHGVALPAGVPDPHRRCSDLALILGIGHDQVMMGDIHPEHLKELLARFQELHPYVDTLVTTLVNPDHGDFFAEAMRTLFPARASSEEDEEERSTPTFQITAYVQDGHQRPLKALEEVRQQMDQQYPRASDYFLPGISTTLRPISQLERKAPPEAHIAVVTDFTYPAVVIRPIAQETRGDASSFSLYGLITRFVSRFVTDENGLLWLHRIVLESTKKADHPAGAKYNETLTDLYDAFLDACGYLSTKRTGRNPILEVRLEIEQRELLERLHTNTNWVITLDRFFTLDYYDSPNHPGLGDVARKYVLDYTPESIEGLGHRMMVTTAWHEEIEALLGQAMNDLGFASVDQSVSHLLHHLKTISGRLALQALESPTNAAAAVGLGVVTAWLQKTNRLRQAVLIPVDIYPQLFSPEGSGKALRGERRCDLMLVSFRRNIFDATFIEVKWRRGQTPLLQELAADMALQMEGSAQAMRNRFFNEIRIDSVLQRSYLANVVRFYFERSRRYNLFDPAAEAPFIEQLTRLEKTGLEFRPAYEGYVVSLDGTQRKPLLIDTQTEKAKIVVLTARDLEEATEFSPLLVWPPTNNSSDPMGVDVENEISQDNSFDGDLSDTIPQKIEGQEAISDVHLDEHIPDRQGDEQMSTGTGEIVIPLGDASGASIEWTPSTKGSPHLFILGIPGQGKSWTITRILCELAEQHVSAMVLDFHGQFADPEGTYMQIIHPSVLDAAKGLPFSPFECTREEGMGSWKATSYALADIFTYVTGLGMAQRDVVQTAIQDAYRAHGFEDGDATDLEYPTPQEVLKRIEQKEQMRHVSNVSARCRPLLEMDLFRPVKDAPDMLSSIRQGLVIDLHNLYAETLQLAAGAFVLRKLYRDMFTWGYADRIRLAIVLDEAHRLARDVTLPKIMKEGRKFGIAVVVASQGMGDFHQDILGNAGTKVIFRINYPDSKKVSGFIRARQGQDLVARIEQLPVGSAYVQTPDMAFGSVVQMYPLE